MSYKGWIGIDPGKDGALARVFVSGEVHVRDVATVQVVDSKKRQKTKYDAAGMVQQLRDLLYPGENPAEVLVALEKVSAGVFTIPGQAAPRTMGVTSAFEFGEGSGLWRGILAALGFAVVRPQPQSWKRVVMADGPRVKEASVPKATELYPRSAGLLRGPRGRALTGRADAILLAHFARVSGDIRDVSASARSLGSPAG